MTEKKSRMAHRKRKTNKRRKWIFIIPILILLIPIGYVGYLYVKADSAISGAYEGSGRDKSDLREEEPDLKQDNVSVLIMGIDENDKRADELYYRTDTLILATFNKEKHDIKLLSIPRDSLVYIPETDQMDKINHAHFYGSLNAPDENQRSQAGSKAAINTVENLLDVPVDYYVKLNFNAFIEVVDALDGIEFDVPYEFKESDSMDKRDAIHLQPGKQTLNGEEALAMARTRKKDSDFARGQRQMEIIKSVVDKSVSLSSVLKYDNIIEALGDNMKTDMSFSDMKSFISYGTNNELDIESYTLDGTDYWPDTYYWQLDEVALKETTDMLREHLNLEPSTATDQEEQVGDVETNVEEGSQDTGENPNDQQPENDGTWSEEQGETEQWQNESNSEW